MSIKSALNHSTTPLCGRPPLSYSVIDVLQLEANKQLNPIRKSELGQYMTSSSIAHFMAKLFTPSQSSIKLLDAGAGVGSLTSAFLDNCSNLPVEVDAWEIDTTLQTYLANTFSSCRAKHPKIKTNIHTNYFIEEAVQNLVSGKGKRFTRAILNPPYKKINSNSKHRLLLRKAEIETVNLYTAFVALSILLMEPQGEIVAIVPRSFCNGPYYKPFRELLLRHCAIKQIHLFESRKKAFKTDDVLQENIIVHMIKNAPQNEVVVSTSHDSEFDDFNQQTYPFSAIVKQQKGECFIHIPTFETPTITSPLFAKTLDEIDLGISTGPVVDFRVKEYWSLEPHHGTAPLLYPHHFTQGSLTYPKVHKKPNAIILCPETLKWLMPQGFYVIVKRFSSKEERRRIVAYVVDPAELSTSHYGFENHWNVFHVKKHGLNELTAYGLAAFLNSTLVDGHFRVFSGHTQVNATDLRTMKYPPLSDLQELGKAVKNRPLSQQQLDNLI